MNDRGGGMSTAIYGFADVDGTRGNGALIESLMRGYTGIGLTPGDRSELHNWPEGHLPKAGDVAFTAYDRADKNSSEYIIDYVDHAPEATIGLPNDKDERLALFVHGMLSILTLPGVQRVLVALTD